MDFTKFSDENFDLKDWINAAFVSQKETNQNQEQFVATLVTKLQVFIQEINNSIDDTSQQTVQNFPRILRDIEMLKQEAFMLKEQMKNVREDLIKVEKNTVNESMKLLLDLDIMRTNMMSMQLALQEADNWTTLTSDLDSILQTKDINAISNHIESMQNSLNLLQDESNDYMNRCILLEDFKNKFETLMSPDIISCFNSKSIESSKNYFQIFGQMNRLDELKKYYYQCEKIKILDKYTKLIGEVNISDSFLKEVVTNEVNLNGDHVELLLKDWLDFLNEVWHNETQWCKQIFNDAHSIVISLLTKCFEESNKSLVKMIDQIIFQHKNDGKHLEYLTKFKLESDRFASIIHSSAENSSLLKNSQLNDLLYKLLQQIYSPYKIYIKHYSDHVIKYLQNQLETNIKMVHNDTIECVQLLNNSVTKVFNLIDKEIERCHILTNGCAFSMLLEAFKSFLKNYIEEFKRVVVNLKERKNQANQAFTKAHVRTNSKVGVTGSGSNVSNSDGGEEDWDTFRHFVKIIQIVGDLMIKYENLEENLDKQIQNCFIHKPSRHVSLSGSNSMNSPAKMITPTQPQKSFQFDSQNQTGSLNNLISINNFKNYLLNDLERIKLNTLISIIESGDDYTIMKDLNKPLYLLSENVHKYAFDIVFAPIKYLVKSIAKSNLFTKSSNDKTNQDQETVPLFALAPQEYITKIGQYLLTLPQNFEPFTMQDNANLIVALHKGKLPYLDEKDLSDDITACWLDSIANATVYTFSEEILNINQYISLNSQRQLIIDIEFLCSVFEDVGLKDFNNLKHILELLKCNKEEFDDDIKNKPARIVSVLRKIRNL